MEEESSYFTAISKRVWTDYDKKEKELSGEVEVLEEKESLEEINGIAELIPATNFHITDDELGQGTPKEKFRANIMAIQLLKKCEDENRNATPEEQEILSRYVGWGGLADAFDETKAACGRSGTVLCRGQSTGNRKSSSKREDGIGCGCGEIKASKSEPHE